MSDPLPESAGEVEPKKPATPRPRKTDQKLLIDIGDKFIKGLVVHSNVKQEMIVTTTDRLRIYLMRCRDNLAARAAWVGPLGVLVSLVAALVAAEFRDFGALRKDHWQALFVLATGGAALWLAQSLWATIKARRSEGFTDPVEDIVNKLKSESPEVSAEVSQPTAPTLEGTAVAGHSSGTS